MWEVLDPVRKANNSFDSHAVLPERLPQDCMQLLISQIMALWKQHESSKGYFAGILTVQLCKQSKSCHSSVWCLIIHRLRRLKQFMKTNVHWWSCHGNSRPTLSMSSKWEPDPGKTVAMVAFGVNGVLHCHWKPALPVHAVRSPCPFN